MIAKCYDSIDMIIHYYFTVIFYSIHLILFLQVAMMAFMPFAKDFLVNTNYQYTLPLEELPDPVS